MRINADEARKIYSLIRNVLRDIRDISNTYSGPEENYKKIYQAIEVIHQDYISFFGVFLDEISTGTLSVNLPKSKRKFYTARRRELKFRLISKVDAHSYLGNIKSLEEMRFLTCAIWYLSYGGDIHEGVINSLEDLDYEILCALKERKIGSHSWASSSSTFWNEIEESEDIDEIIFLTKNMIQFLLDRYTLLRFTFNELPSRLNARRTKITQTKFSELVVKTAQERDDRYIGGPV